MVSYETIPADPAAEDGLLATPQPKTSLKRILGAAALTSFVLGALAATALTMPAGVPQTMLNDPGCNNDNAPIASSHLTNKLNHAMNTGKKEGFIFRFRYDGQIPCDQTNYDGTNGFDKICGDTHCKDDNCGVAATLLSNQVHTENPVYCINNPHGCNSPSVGYALLDNWSMRGGEMGGWAYFPTDANSVDGRDWQNGGGFPGQGCHGFQEYMKVDDSGTLVTYDSIACKCDYDDFNTNDFGDYIVNTLNEKYGTLQPARMGQDFSACWITEEDPLHLVFEIQNSIYNKRNSWWNGAIGGEADPISGWEFYQGWNEVAFDGKIDHRETIDKLEALVVVIPDGFNSLCDFDKDIAQEVDDVLFQYWTDGYGTLPVVILKNTKVHGKYTKNTFRQTFYFAHGNCIVDGGDGNNYYFVKDDGKC